MQVFKLSACCDKLCWFSWEPLSLRKNIWSILAQGSCSNWSVFFDMRGYCDSHSVHLERLTLRLPGASCWLLPVLAVKLAKNWPSKLVQLFQRQNLTKFANLITLLDNRNSIRRNKQFFLFFFIRKQRMPETRICKFNSNSIATNQSQKQFCSPYQTKYSNGTIHDVCVTSFMYRSCWLRMRNKTCSLLPTCLCLLIRGLVESSSGCEL